MSDNKKLINLAKKIGEMSSRSAISLVISLMESINQEEKDKDKLLEYIYKAKNDLSIFSGNGQAEYDRVKLIKDILCVEKENNKIVMKNIELDSLSYEEFEYVFGWAMRIALDKKNEAKPNSQSSKPTYKNNSRVSFNKNDREIEIDERWSKLKEFK